MSIPNPANGAAQSVIDKLSAEAVDGQKNGCKVDCNGVHADGCLNGIAAGLESKADGVATGAYSILEEPSRLGRPIRVIVIGAGASALSFAHDIDSSSLDIQLAIYEKNPEIGGTWFENKYPGCACDIPSVNYQFSWAPSTHWSS